MTGGVRQVDRAFATQNKKALRIAEPSCFMMNMKARFKKTCFVMLTV